MKLLLVIILCLISSFSYAQSPHRRGRDRLILTPERELIRIEREGDFRIYVRNTFPSALQDLKLMITNPAFEIEIAPAIITRLVPGERRFFLVKLRLREGFEEGDYPLRINVQAKGADLGPIIEAAGIIAEEVGVEPLGEKIVKPQVVEAGEIVVRVERFVFTEGGYIYLAPILLIGLLFWRKLKQK